MSLLSPEDMARRREEYHQRARAGLQVWESALETLDPDLRSLCTGDPATFTPIILLQLLRELRKAR